VIETEAEAEITRPQDPIDPAVAPLLARMREIGGPDDARPEAEILDDLDLRALEIQKIVGGWREEARAAEIAAEVARLQDAAIERPEALGALREAIAKRRRALGLSDERRVASLSERLLARLQAPPLVHVPTSLPTLDAATRGGLLMRRVHVIGGEPDAGKTALLVQVLMEAARQGYAVAIYAVDEPGEGIEDRIGQSLGVGLKDLEANRERAIRWLADAVRDLPHVLLIEQGEQGFATIEDAADALLVHAKRHGLRGAVLGVDSLQTAACRAYFGPHPPRLDRERIEAMTTSLKAIAKRGVSVLVTSELGRASYAQKPGQKPASPMAAFKGSGSIEYSMTVGLVLTRITKGDHAGDVYITVPKNKRGDPAYRGVKIRLERDPDRCTYTDRGRIDLDEEEREAPKKPAPENNPKLDSYMARLRKALAGLPNGFNGSRDDLVRLAGGKAALTRTALALLITRGEVLVERPQGQPARLRLRSAADVSAPQQAAPQQEDDSE